MRRLRLAGLRKPDGERERVLFVAKVVALVVVAGVVTGALLLSGGGGSDEVAVTDPAVPTITGSGGPEPARPAPPRPSETVAAPAVGTHTAVIAVKPRPTRPTPRLPDRDPRFVRIGAPCVAEGAIAVTRRFEPLMCRDGRWDRLFS